MLIFWSLVLQVVLLVAIVILLVDALLDGAIFLLVEALFAWWWYPLRQLVVAFSVALWLPGVNCV